METQIRRVVFTDEWFEIAPSGEGGLCAAIRTFCHKLVLPPVRRTYEFQNYVLGYRWVATEREMEILRSNDMFGHRALQLRDNCPSITFADLLGSEFIPEVNPDQAELFHVEARVREAAVKWTLFLENLDQRFPSCSLK